jgi:putative pyoverdin transport system ATP-binding/permease protein
VAQGYKISFFKARPFNAPLYRANDPAGYIISDIRDLRQWLLFQMGALKTGTILDQLVGPSHSPDLSVAIDRASLAAYGAGWQIYFSGTGMIAHSGLNPNFSSHIAFLPEEMRGVAIIANSNSPYTSIIADHLLKIISTQPVPPDPLTDGTDGDLSIISIFLLLYVLCVLAYIGVKSYSCFRRGDKQVYSSSPPVKTFILPLFPMALGLAGLYFLPGMLVGFSWDAAIVWAPGSFFIMSWSAASSILISYVAYIFNALWPGKNKYLNDLPTLAVLSILSGLSNAVVVILIMSVASEKVGSDNTGFFYRLLYFLGALFFYILGRRVVQVILIRLSLDIVRDIRKRLFQRVFSAVYQDFEAMDRGRIYATLNNDTETIGGASDALVNILTSFITIVAVFAYLMAISLQTSLITLLSILLIVLLYTRIDKRSRKSFEAVRLTSVKYLELLNGMIDGFKELSIHRVKRAEYKKELEDVNIEFHEKMTKARIGFVYVFLTGETLLISMLAFVAFGFPRIFPGVDQNVIVSYVIATFYLMGPVNIVLGMMPAAMQIRVAWRRVQAFMKDMETPGSSVIMPPFSDGTIKNAHHLSIEGIQYQYGDDCDQKGFRLGPIEFEMSVGEVVFIIGDNGSGKTTLLKLLTGLYRLECGTVRIDGKIVDTMELGEYFSVIFNPFHLFRKLYGVDADAVDGRLTDMLTILGLDKKVGLNGKQYTTIQLSQGQRKRLALLQCQLENRPIYLFDEWAAEQDPQYRKLFYKVLIPEMRAKGKLIIIISHDDQYFGEADQIIRLNSGQQELLKIKPKSPTQKSIL